MRPATIGLLFGLLAGSLAAQAVRSLLLGVKTIDITTFLLVPAVTLPIRLPFGNGMGYFRRGKHRLAARTKLGTDADDGINPLPHGSFCLMNRHSGCIQTRDVIALHALQVPIKVLHGPEKRIMVTGTPRGPVPKPLGENLVRATEDQKENAIKVVNQRMGGQVLRHNAGEQDRCDPALVDVQGHTQESASERPVAVLRRIKRRSPENVAFQAEEVFCPQRDGQGQGGFATAASSCDDGEGSVAKGLYKRADGTDSVGLARIGFVNQVIEGKLTALGTGKKHVASSIGAKGFYGAGWSMEWPHRERTNKILKSRQLSKRQRNHANETQDPSFAWQADGSDPFP